MIALIALVVRVLIALAMPSADSVPVMVIPPMPASAPVIEEFTTVEEDAYDDAWCEFTNLFNSYEVKRAKNGALMIRRGNSGSYRFAKKG